MRIQYNIILVRPAAICIHLHQLLYICTRVRISLQTILTLNPLNFRRSQVEWKARDIIGVGAEKTDRRGLEYLAVRRE